MRFNHQTFPVQNLAWTLKGIKRKERFFRMFRTSSSIIRWWVISSWRIWWFLSIFTINYCNLMELGGLNNNKSVAIRMIERERERSECELLNQMNSKINYPFTRWVSKDFTSMGLLHFLIVEKLSWYKLCCWFVFHYSLWLPFSDLVTDVLLFIMNMKISFLFGSLLQ